jgi:hypothetical protein
MTIKDYTNNKKIKEIDYYLFDNVLYFIFTDNFKIRIRVDQQFNYNTYISIIENDKTLEIKSINSDHYNSFIKIIEKFIKISNFKYKD